MTDHQRTLREAIDTIPPGDGPTRVGEAVALARRLLSGSEKIKKTSILTDAGFDGAAELTRQDDVELIALGKKTGNVGITQLQARRSLVDPIGYEILVEVANASDDKEPVSFRLELDLGDDPIDVVPLTLQPGERTVQVFEKTSADGGRLRARIDRADALAADNTAWAILPKRSRQKVTLVDTGQCLPRKGLRGDPAGRPGASSSSRRAAPVPTPSAAGQDGRSSSTTARCPTTCRRATSSSSSPGVRARSGEWARCCTTRSSPARTRNRR